MAPPPDRVSLVLMGLGGVGKVFLRQLYCLVRDRRLPSAVDILYVSTSSRALYHEDWTPLPFTLGSLDDVASLIEATAAAEQKPMDFEALAAKLEATLPTAPVILVDNTSSEDVALAYPIFLRYGVHIVTPNKKPFSGSWAMWQHIQQCAVQNNTLVYHEASVGAGLPVISTLQDLVLTCDRVERIEGVFSGTLSYLFNSFSPLANAAADPEAAAAAEPKTWSSEVARAKELGYTEPDPRDDLNGLDVARKLIILARTCGLAIQSPDHFPVQSLIPEALRTCQSGDEFLARLPDHDAEMAALKEEAEAAGQVLRYVASIDLSTATLEVGVKRLDKTHPIAGLQGSDNIFSFHTQRYGAQPLVIQGAGAGGEVTAMGVMSDLVKLMRRL